MKILKRILFALLILIGLVLLIALFLPNDFAVEKAITVNKPREFVFQHVKSLKFQNEWSVWNELDPNAKHEFKGEDGTVGFIASWDGNEDMGAGEQEIIAITEGERMETELRFLRPMEIKNYCYMTTESINENETNVKWGFKGSFAYPFNVFLLFLNMEKNIGNDFEKGLQKFKTLVEAKENLAENNQDEVLLIIE